MEPNFGRMVWNSKKADGWVEKQLPTNRGATGKVKQRQRFLCAEKTNIFNGKQAEKIA